MLKDCFLIQVDGQTEIVLFQIEKKNSHILIYDGNWNEDFCYLVSFYLK
jgi:hypothetical protein